MRSSTRYPARAAFCFLLFCLLSSGAATASWWWAEDGRHYYTSSALAGSPQEAARLRALLLNAPNITSLAGVCTSSLPATSSQTGRPSGGVILGVTLTDFDSINSDGVPPNTKGAVVQMIRSGLPAQRAGIQVDDIISEMNGQRAGSAQELAGRLHNLPPEKGVSLVVWRHGAAKSIEITSSTRSETAPRFEVRWASGSFLFEFGSLYLTRQEAPGTVSHTYVRYIPRSRVEHSEAMISTKDASGRMTGLYNPLPFEPQKVELGEEWENPVPRLIASRGPDLERLKKHLRKVTEKKMIGVCGQ